MTATSFRNDAAIVEAWREAARNLLPPPDLLPTEWAEASVHIPIGNRIPGPIRFDNAPYQRGMLNVIKEPGVRRVSYMTGAQLGKTTVQQCIAGYFIEHEPRSQIFAQPSEGDMLTFQETKLRPMLEANPSIAEKMAKPRGREGVNNSRIISYIGGWLMFSWAGSPKTARGRSAPVVQADEIDGMPPTKEGDFVELLAQRAATFGDQALRIESSTPTVKGTSRIENAYEISDQRRFYVACPDCGAAQYFRWENVTWKGRMSTSIDDADEDLKCEHQPESARYVCEGCGSLWDDGQRISAIRSAETLGHGWKATKPFRGHAGFHAPEMLSTFRRLRDIVQSYLDKLKAGDLQSFVNVSLAEAYEEKGERADPTGLLARCVPFAAPVPQGGVYLTAGIDMQPDRLELEVVAWGVAEESWSVDYRVLWGDPLGDEVWDELEDVLSMRYLHESGAALPISAACLDTGGTGSYTQRAYEWLRGKAGRRIFGVKGVGGWDRPIVERGLKKQSGKKARKVNLYLVGTDEAKLVVMRRLAMESPGPGYCHFPEGRDEHYFDQLTAEKLVTRYVKGFAVREWHKPEKARNEALDCRVYALAALKIMQPMLKKIAERLAMPAKSAPQLPQLRGRTEAENPQEEAKPAAKEDKPRIKRSSAVSRRRGGWVRNW